MENILNYTIIGLDSQKNILGNFLYINDNLDNMPFDNKFNIIIVESIESLPDINDLENNKIVTLFPNKQYYFCSNIQEVFDRFQLPYYFTTKENIEKYY